MRTEEQRKMDAYGVRKGFTVWALLLIALVATGQAGSYSTVFLFISPLLAVAFYCFLYTIGFTLYLAGPITIILSLITFLVAKGFVH